MEQITDFQLKVAKEVFNLVAGVGKKIEAKFPEMEGYAIANCFLLAAMIRIASQYGTEGCAQILDELAERLRNGTLRLTGNEVPVDPSKIN